MQKSLSRSLGGLPHCDRCTVHIESCLHLGPWGDTCWTLKGFTRLGVLSWWRLEDRKPARRKNHQLLQRWVVRKLPTHLFLWVHSLLLKAVLSHNKLQISQHNMGSLEPGLMPNLWIGHSLSLPPQKSSLCSRSVPCNKRWPCTPAILVACTSQARLVITQSCS